MGNTPKVALPRGAKIWSGARVGPPRERRTGATGPGKARDGLGEWKGEQGKAGEGTRPQPASAKCQKQRIDKKAGEGMRELWWGQEFTAGVTLRRPK